jgi:acyl transferase domain-containing protein/phosphopantetheinyl transferase (holo-ACP synthase)
MADEAAVAIVGMAVTFPKAPDLASYRDNVFGGVDAISDVPAARWDPVFYDPKHAGIDRFYCRRGGFVDDETLVDPIELGIVPAAVASAEPDQLLTLSLAARALADAGTDVLAGRAERTGVIVGRGGYLTPGLARLDQRVRTAEQLVRSLRTLVPEIDEENVAKVKDAFVAALGPVGPETAIDLVPNLAASRVANRLDLGGPAYTVDAACASSLVAVDHAVRELVSARCDLVVAGGVHLCHDVTLWSVFTQLQALSRMEEIRPFDQAADGLLIGEGGGVVVLERLADAERRGAHIYAVVRGCGVSSDGRGGSLMRPSVGGQVLALERAWQEAAISRSSIGLYEAHGTATPAGDAAELETVRSFFGPIEGGEARRVLGSVKSMIGHAMPAAGIAGLAKVALALEGGVLPPSLHCEDPHPLLAETRFDVIGEARDWEPGPRVAAVSAFGFGGINAHVVLTSHPSSASPSPTARLATRLLPTSGDDVRLEPLEPVLVLAAPTLDELVRRFEQAASGQASDGVPGLPEGEGDFRLAIVGPTPERLALARKVIERGTPFRRNDVWFAPGGLLTEPGAQLAFLFPGVEPTFEPQVADIADWLGRPLPELVGADAAAHDLEGLGRSLVAVSRLLDAACEEIGLRPDVSAGQSIGEWSGMISTEMIPTGEVDRFIDTLRPGSLEVPGVAFAALGCTVEAAEALRDDLPGVYVSHDNCPHQTILCGGDEAIATVLARAKAAKVLGQLLPFRSGFHTPLFAPFVEPFRVALARLPLQEPRVPLWSATTCAPYPADADAVRQLALAHLVEQVRFRELVIALYAASVKVFVQMGTGGLTGLVEDTLHGANVAAIAANSPRRSGRAQLLRAGLACWVEGRDGISVEPLARRRPSGARRQARQRLSLGAPLVSLPDSVAGLLGGRSAAVPPSFPAAADRSHPIVAELSALWDEMRAASSEIEAALGGQTGTPPPPELASTTDRMLISLETHPELIDHCFYRQPPGWAEDSDRFPVVPMTGLIELMISAATEIVAGAAVVAVEDIRALRWLAVAPPVEVEIRAEELAQRDGGQRRVRVAIDGYARATVVLAPSYPAPPGHGDLAANLASPEPVPVTPTGLYDDRWLFHGPAYRGVRVLGPMSEEGIDGELESGSALGSLLDNAGQLMGFWIMYRHELDRLGLPTTIDRIELYGPPPAPGEHVKCAVRVSSVTANAVRADLELKRGSDVWARIRGWEDHRFDSDGVVWPVLIWPEHSALSTQTPACYEIAQEHWRSSASRELMMRRYLGPTERAEYARRNPRAQRQFLLGRIAATDAVRRILWAEGETDVWPVEVEILNDSSGRPQVSVRGDHDMRVSIAHTPFVGVAIAARGVDVGIDAESVEPRSETFRRASFADTELDLILADRAAQDHDEWLTRAWAAKEAVGKALGSGFGGRPKDFRITACGPECIVVNGWKVDTERVGEFVVAWTRGD